LFVVLLLYHLSALRKDGAARADVLETRQEAFGVLVFDSSDRKFGESVRSAFAKHAPRVPLTVVDPKDGVAGDLKFSAAILSGSLAVNPPENVAAWNRSFAGIKLIVADEAAGLYWVNEPAQAAESVRGLAEGQEIRPQSAGRGTPVWTTIAYAFAALFACQLLIGLLFLGVGMINGF
jgi:hypothetical protein